MIEISWRAAPAGRIGDVTVDGDHVGFVRVAEDWYEPDGLTRQRAWVLDWIAPGIDVMQRALVELGGEPAATSDREDALAAKARRVLALGPPEMPTGFGSGPTGFDSAAELRELVELTSFGVQEAEARVMAAARRTDEHAAALLNVAAFEIAGWLRSFDELMTEIWEERLTAAQRERVSVDVDAMLASPGVDGRLVADAVDERQRTGQPYSDWTLAPLSRGVGLPRFELRAWRWLAGKLLHHGPLSVVERRSWRMGAEPRWKWRTADAIYPPRFVEQRQNQRLAWDRCLAGRDVMGTTNFVMALIETELLFVNLLGESTRPQ